LRRGPVRIAGARLLRLVIGKQGIKLAAMRGKTALVIAGVLAVILGAAGWLGIVAQAVPGASVAAGVVAGLASAGLVVVWIAARSGVLGPGRSAEELEGGFELLARRLTSENEILAERVNTLISEHQNSELYIDTLMKSVPANIYFKDRESRFVRVNQSQASWLGHGHTADLIGKTDHDFFDREHADQASEDEKQIMRTGEPIVGYVERETLPTGEEAWVLTTKMPFRDRAGNIIGTFGISNDVSELVRAQQTLERERNILRALIDSFPDHIYIKDSEGRFMVVNKSFATFVGEEDPARVLGRRDPDFFPMEMVKEYERQDRAVLESGEPILNQEGIRRTHDGGERIVVVNKIPLLDETDTPYAIVGMNRDVTDQRLAREALLRSERQLEDIIDNSPAVIFLKGVDGRYQLINRRYETLFHVRREDVVGKTDYDIFSRETADAFRGNDELVVEEGEAIQVEEIAPQDDGLHTYVSVKFPLRDLSGQIEAVGGVSTDITDRKKQEEALKELNAELMEANESLTTAQEQLIQAEKMESVGRLAAGVAHEVKNPLAMIAMGLEIVARRAAQDDEKLAETVERMRRGIERAKDIIKGLVDFSAAHQLKLEEHNVNDIVKETLALARYQIEEGGVKIVTEYADGLPNALLDATKIEQVLLNLCINAQQAMADGGELTVRTRQGILEGLERDDGTRVPGTMRKGSRYVAIDVEDTGPGIDEEKMAKIFDPFFTTKMTGEGTGLGLSVVRKIVDLHQGMIEIDNRPEGGVRATLTFRAE